MGLFDRFKKRVQEVAEEVDSDALTADADSQEGKAAIEVSKNIEEDWDEDIEDVPIAEEPQVESIDDDWDDWDDEEEDEIQLPVVMSKKERKRLEKLQIDSTQPQSVAFPNRCPTKSGARRCRSQSRLQISPLL